LKNEFQKYSRELAAVEHHRAVLKNTVEQMEKQLKQSIDSSYPVEYNKRGDDVDHLRKQIMRYQAKSTALEELCNTYRTSVLAMYADGASYGAAQFGWQPYGTDDPSLTANQVHVIGVAWIEREVNAIKHSYENEIRVLESEIDELRAKLNQSNFYNMELRKHFEDNIRAIHR
jgi:Skp family chaperone for outer membrane proteins